MITHDDVLAEYARCRENLKRLNDSMGDIAGEIDEETENADTGVEAVPEEIVDGNTSVVTHVEEVNRVANSVIASSEERLRRLG